MALTSLTVSSSSGVAFFVFVMSGLPLLVLSLASLAFIAVSELLVCKAGDRVYNVHSYCVVFSVIHICQIDDFDELSTRFPHRKAMTDLGHDLLLIVWCDAFIKIAAELAAKFRIEDALTWGPGEDVVDCLLDCCHIDVLLQLEMCFLALLSVVKLVLLVDRVR